MTATTIRVQMAQRKDTAANWTAANPILLSGEIGYETDTKKFKIGDGTTNWNSLAYLPIPDGSGNLTITGNLEIGTTGSLTFEGSTANGFETTLAVTDPTADRTITLPNVSGTVVTTGDTGSVTSTMLADGTIVNADISGSAEIAVSKLANGTANQVIVTDGTNVSWSDSLTLAGDLTVNGTTTTINTQDLLVEDKNIIIGNVATPSDVTADGGGITLKGATDKTINWVDATDAWTSSERFSYPLGSATAPSLTFTGDPNTGIYSPGADQVAISTNGTQRLLIEADGDINIDSGGVFYDATNNRLAIGTTSPGSELSVVGTGNATTGWSVGSEDGATSGGLYNAGSTSNSISISADPGNAGVNSNILFLVDTTERARIDSSGRLLIGTSSAYATPLSTTVLPITQIHTNSSADNSAISQLMLTSWSAGADVGPSFSLNRADSGTIGTFSPAIGSSDVIGNIRFNGSDGVKFIETAKISAVADGTWGVDDGPTRLVFSTSADGASTTTERLRITNDGVQAYNQPAPAAVNATATLTVANLKTGIITSTSAAATDMTLPTGTDTETGFSGTIYTNMTFGWSVINTGPSLVRVLAGTAHTIVGSGSVATGTSGRFASRRTAANTFVTYRLS